MSTPVHHTDLVQGTDEWLEARRGIVTASTLGALITAKTIRPSVGETARSLVATLAAERITGRIEPVFVSDDMLRGQMDEPRARDMYAEHTGATVTEVGFITLGIGGAVLGYSPDGLVGDDGLIEVKSRKPKKHLQTIVSDQVPPENVAQLQAGLLVTGRAWIDYVSICGGMPLYIKRVLPDERWRDAITEAVEMAETSIVDMIARYEAAGEMPVPEYIDYFNEIEF